MTSRHSASARPTRVAIFAYTGDAPTLDTGVTTYNRELVRHLCLRYPEHEFTLYLAEVNAARFPGLGFTNLRLVVLPGGAAPTDGGLSALVRRATFLVTFVARELLHLGGIRTTRFWPELYTSVPGLERHDVVFYTVFGVLPDFPLYIKRILRLKCVSVIHDIRVLYESSTSLRKTAGLRMARYILSRIVRESDRSLVPSQYIWNVLSSRLQAHPESVFVSYVVPEVRDEDRPDRRLSSEADVAAAAHGRYILYPSTITKTKNHLNLVRAVEILRNELPQVKLLLTGSNTGSALGRDIFDYVSERGLSENIVHLGFVTEGEKVALYRHAVALVVPSIGESFSLPIWEAFALGCPVIASTDRDIPEQVADAAVLCDPENPADIARGIKDVWSDEALRCRLIVRGKERYQRVRHSSIFSGWESIIDLEVGT